MLKYSLLAFAGLASAGNVKFGVGIHPTSVRFSLDPPEIGAASYCRGGPFEESQAGTVVEQTQCPDKIAPNWVMLCSASGYPGHFSGSYVIVNGKKYCEDIPDDQTRRVVEHDGGEMPKHRWMRAGQ